MASRIIDFYNGGTDHKGRTIAEIINLDNKAFDECHDFIQWLFPLHEDSRMSPVKFPLVTVEDSNYFKQSANCKIRVLLALERYVIFLDEMGDDFWCNDGDHNLLRITRIIRSLRFFGLESIAKDFYEECTSRAISRHLDKKTCTYWERALKEPLFATLY